jgi:hypothetical protein
VTPTPPTRRYRCRYCGGEFPARLPVMQAPDGPMLLHHLSKMHPTEVGPYLERMATEDIATVAAEAYEVVEDEEQHVRRGLSSKRTDFYGRRGVIKKGVGNRKYKVFRCVKSRLSSGVLADQQGNPRFPRI